MTHRRLGELARAVGAFVGLVVLVVGVPAALAVGVGWPLPHAVPTLSALHRLFTGRFHPTGAFYLKVVAIVAWIAWLEVAACAVAEIRAVVAGRRAWRVRFAGPLQPLVAALVAAVVLALPPSGIRTPAQPSSLVVALSAMTTSRHSVLIDDHVLEAAPGRNAAPSTDEATHRRTDPIRVTVEARETLWGLAERYLGNPLDWREIFDMNVGKPQPGGGSLTDPSLIRPGWVLELPARAVGHLPAEHLAHHRHESPQTKDSHGHDEQLGHHRPPAPHSTNGHAPPSDEHRGARGAGDGAHPRPRTTPRSSSSAGPLVELPSGAVLSTSFLAGVAAAVAIGRLRRRRGYRPRKPVAGWSGRGWEPASALARLLRAGQRPPADTDDPDNGGEASAASVETSRTEVDVPLGCALVGQKGGEPVIVDIAGGGLAIDGPGAADVARAILAEVVTRYLPGQVECVVESALWPDLLAGVATFPGLRSARSLDDFLREAEVELIRRVRLFEDEELPDLGAYWDAHPEDPIPVLLGFCSPTGSVEGRLAGILDLGQRVGIGALVVGGSSVVRTMATVDDHGYVETTSSPALEDAQLVCVGAEESAAALVVVGDARRVEDEPAAQEAPVDQPDMHQVAEMPSSSTDAPVRVDLLGSFRIEVAGEEVRSGMRAKARELLAWFCCHPEGGTPEAVVEALWPEVDPKKVGQRFWNSVTSLRGRLREVSGFHELRLLDRYGTRYHLVDGELNADLWELEHALTAASDAPDEQVAVEALARAAELYTGDLLEDCDWLWAEPLRGDLRSRILDTLTRLAKIRDESDANAQALSALDRAINIDPFAEELYRQKMTLLGITGRSAAVRRTLNDLTTRLEEIGLDPAEETLELAKAYSDSSRAVTG